MDEATAKANAALQAEIDRQRPLYRSALAAAAVTVTNTLATVGVVPMSNSVLISLAEMAAEQIAAVPDPALRLVITESFIKHMGGAVEHYLPQFENGQRQSVAIHDSAMRAN